LRARRSATSAQPSGHAAIRQLRASKADLARRHQGGLSPSVTENFALSACSYATPSPGRTYASSCRSSRASGWTGAILPMQERLCGPIACPCSCSHAYPTALADHDPTQLSGALNADTLREHIGEIVARAVVCRSAGYAALERGRQRARLSGVAGRRTVRCRLPAILIGEAGFLSR